MASKEGFVGHDFSVVSERSSFGILTADQMRNQSALPSVDLSSSEMEFSVSEGSASDDVFKQSSDVQQAALPKINLQSSTPELKAESSNSRNMTKRKPSDPACIPRHLSDRSSFGILTAEQMTCRSALPSASSNLSPLGLDIAEDPNNADAVFKQPLAPTGVPSHLLGLQDSFDVSKSVMSTGSVDWSRLLASRESRLSNNNDKENVEPTSFETLRRDASKHDSFFDGQFSARSTSIGGSSSSGSTRHFDDLSIRFPNRQPSLLFDGPEGFSSLDQNGFSGEELFEVGQSGLAKIDQAQRDFEREQEVSFVNFNHNFSASANPALNLTNGTALMSQSAYFMQNSSNVGFLHDDTYDAGRQRPTLGMSSLESNTTSLSSKKGKSNSTVDAPIKLLQNDAAQTDQSKNKSRSYNPLTLPSEESSKADAIGKSPRTIQDLMRDLGAKKRDSRTLHVKDTRLEKSIKNDVLSESNLLPSFLEESVDLLREEDALQEEPSKQSGNETNVRTDSTPGIVLNPPENVKDTGPLRRREERALATSKLPRPVRSPSPTNNVSRVVKSGIPLPSAKSQPRVRSQRFSSPIKADEPILQQGHVKPVENVASPLPPEKATCNKHTSNSLYPSETGFPIECDHTSVAFLCVEGTAEEQLILMNVLDRSISVKCIIRNAPAFSLSIQNDEYAPCHTLEIAPRAKASLRVRFSSNTNGLHQGKLVLKPQQCATRNNNQRALKASLTLTALNEAPKLELKLEKSNLMADYIIKFSSQQSESNFVVTNSGTAAAFVVLHFSDDKMDGAPNISVKPDRFVLQQQDSRSVTVSLDPQRLSGRKQLIVHSGPELTRGPLKKLLATSQSKLNLDVVHQLRLLEDFEDEQQVVSTFLNGVQLKTNSVLRQLSNNLKKFAIEIDTIHTEFDVSPNNTMVPLMPEDTLSESRIDASVILPSSAKASTMAPIPEIPANTKAPKGSVGHGIFFMEKDDITFKDTKFGSKSLSKLVFKNRSKERKLVKVIRKPLEPFDCKQDMFVVQPCSFLSLPVHFKPLVLGPSKGEMSLETEGRVWIVSLKGNCVKQ